MATIILAKIFGLYALAVGIALILNPDRFKKMYAETMKDENFLTYGGILALLIGASVVAVHNFWVMGWPVIITLLGWWSIIKGSGLLICPTKFVQLFDFVQNRSQIFYRIAGFIWLTLGLFLTYQGWWS